MHTHLIRRSENYKTVWNQEYEMVMADGHVIIADAGIINFILIIRDLKG